MSRYLTRPEAAEFIRGLGLPIAKNSLTKFASLGGGPPYQIFGNKAVYLEEEICALGRGPVKAWKVSRSQNRIRRAAEGAVMGRRGPISSAEIIDLSVGIVDDIIDQLESDLAMSPRPLIEAAADNARHLRDMLTSRRAAGRKALEDFVRDHPVGEPYDPDKFDVEDF